MPVRLRLFGSPQLEVEQTMQDLPIERPISLGLYLAVRGDWVRRSELMYLYYPDAEESLAQSNLRKLLYRLKQRSWAAGLEAEPSRLRLVLASDVTDFRSAIAEKNYTRALELYKGAFLEGVQFPGLVGFDAWIELERSDLARIWRSALLEEVERLTAQNAYPEAERWLLRAWQQDPFDESVFQRILQVLHAAGQPARGLVLFAEFAAKLREQGMTPLESTIRLAQGLDANQGLAPKHNLPEFAARFFGRVSELERFKQWLYNPECRLITVVGLGGVGKTRFVIEALREQPSHFVDGVWFVPLVGVFSLELLISGIASAVSFAFSGATKTEVQLQNHLRAKEMLLFLDNFEQLTEHSSWL
ncbi:MAG: BTAD domain-containing putative transcriptional regulator, partial [Deinococcales bacterium]